jgi:hypothetical protein
MYSYVVRTYTRLYVPKKKGDNKMSVRRRRRRRRFSRDWIGNAV